MRRRDFLHLAAWSGAAATVGATLVPPRHAAAAPARPARGRAAPHRAAVAPEATVADLRAALAGGALTAAALTRHYLDRIERLDRRGPRLNAVIEVNPDALALAATLDQERQAGRVRGPLHGVPVLIKDNLDTHDRMGTTAGSLALLGDVPPRDAGVVERLRAAGAVLLGKTNLSEWANLRSARSTSGWSGRGGLTRNPYALDRNAAGSSTGSAVAVAADLCAVAVGTETDGSILAPSAYCGLVGLKPTVGLVSRAGIVPIAHSQDTAGPMARTVADAAALLGALAGPDPRDPATRPAARRALPDYTRVLDPGALRGARLGVARKLWGFHDATDAVMEGALAALRRAGAILVDPADLPSHGKLDEPELEVLLHEFKADLAAYLATRGPGVRVRTLKDVIGFNERHRAREMPFFGQDLFLKAEAKGPLTDQAYRDALAACRRLARDEGIDAVVRAHRVDAIIAPTCGPAHLTDLVVGDRFLGGATTPAAVAGYPSVTVPAGHVFGLPVGLTFFGPAWSEPRLLALAFAFEQTTKARQPPRFAVNATLTG